MAFDQILKKHIERYPVMQIRDLYKLIHQAAMGSEHAVRDLDGARGWMNRELSEMGDGPLEPVIDPISEDGQIVRVHLRPFVAQGGDVESLLKAFVRTANEYRGTIETFERYWQVASNELDFPRAEMDAFIAAMKTAGYPAVHHTPAFEETYRPAYRVVWIEFLETNGEIWKPQP